MLFSKIILINSKSTHQEDFFRDRKLCMNFSFGEKEEMEGRRRAAYAHISRNVTGYL